MAYALAMDALDHDGPASEARVDRAACAQAFAPGVDPTYLDTYLQIVSVVPGVAADVAPVNTIGVPVEREERALRCYVFAECTAASGGSDAAGRCVSATATARGTVFGPAALGRTRASQRRRLPGRRGKKRKGIDRFCVAGGGALEIGYPTSAHLAQGPPRGARPLDPGAELEPPVPRARAHARRARVHPAAQAAGRALLPRGAQPLVRGARREGDAGVPHPPRPRGRRGPGQPPADARRRRHPAAAARLAALTGH